jgi:hypothetical protein
MHALIQLMRVLIDLKCAPNELMRTRLGDRKHTTHWIKNHITSQTMGDPIDGFYYLHLPSMVTDEI